MAFRYDLWETGLKELASKYKITFEDLHWKTPISQGGGWITMSPGDLPQNLIEEAKELFDMCSKS